MCLIITRPRDTQPIPENFIREAAFSNPDGFGIVGVGPSGKVYLNKDLDMGNSTDWIRTYEKGNCEFVAHFRWATHGEKDYDNAHPFQLRGSNYIAHNGILDVPTPIEGRSDTWHFVEGIKAAGVAMKPDNVLKYLGKRKKILGGSKFAMLGADLPLTVFNREAGEEIDGIWYSNPGAIRPYTSKYYSGYSGRDWTRYSAWEDEGSAVWDFSGGESLEDLCGMSLRDLKAICAEYPDDVAEIIAGSRYARALEGWDEEHGYNGGFEADPEDIYQDLDDVRYLTHTVQD